MGFVSGKISTSFDEFRHSSTRSISIFQTANRHYINAVLSAVSVITNTYNHHQKSRAFHFYNKFFGVLADAVADAALPRAEKVMPAPSFGCFVE